MQKLIRWIRRFFRRNSVKQFVSDVKKNRYRPGLYKNFDWPLFILVMLISLFGVVAIFSATSSATETEVSGLINVLSAHSTRYPTLQLIWMLAGTVIMFLVTLLDYRLYGKYHQLLYIANIAILLLVLGMEAGRGGMRAFFTISTSSSTLGQRGFQPSEFGKFIMMICLAKLFSMRKAPIKNLQELLPTALYVVVPMILVFLQPDFGTALVYMVMYVVLLYISGTKRKLIYGLLAVVIAIAIPLWFYFNTASDSFRLTRILMWLNPDQYPDEARQVINGQIAIGSGGFTGKGVVSVGSFASLGYIPDDHTDFCFAIVCEAFGFIGAMLLVIAFMVFLGRLIHHALHTQDTFGEYIIVCATAMFMFHILENICMILGILPVTGIPLPFISYGGSNYITNMASLGLVMNVVMRSRQKQLGGQAHYSGTL
ncbi:MAG: rod shape-determining protein RodA [Clostridiales bacterium]|nr:rod shape-determining protein RodA [Clostridiales bacterium]